MTYDENIVKHRSLEIPNNKSQVSNKLQLLHHSSIQIFSRHGGMSEAD